MTDNNTDKKIDNDQTTTAEIIIERFGGIRPMAKKLGIAVTTVQGWKKRGNIPKRRRTELLSAAKKHGINLDDVVSKTANQNNTNQINTAVSAQTPERSKPEETKPPEQVKAKSNKVTGTLKAERPSIQVQAGKVNVSSLSAPIRRPASSSQGRKDVRQKEVKSERLPDNFDQKLLETQYKAITKSTWITVFVVLLTLMIVGAVLFPYGHDIRKVNENSQSIVSLSDRVDDLQGNVDDLAKNQSFFSTLIPKDLDERIKNLQNDAKIAQDGLNKALEEAKRVQDDVLSADSGTFSQRLDKLETRLKAIAGSPELRVLLRRMETLGKSMPGQVQLDEAVKDLSTAVSGTGTMTGQTLTESLHTAQTNSEAVAQTFQGIPQDDLKAAALLLGMNQFRQAVNRDNTQFEDDVSLLIALIGEDDPALTESLRRLAPHAKSGVLTPAGLNDELRSMTGEIITESLKGENVSLQDRVQARLNSVLKVEKRGQLVTGTKTQATLNDVTRFLEAGNLEAAIKTAETLSGPEAQVIAPWLEKARATRQAQAVKTVIEKNLQTATFNVGGAL